MFGWGPEPGSSHDPRLSKSTAWVCCLVQAAKPGPHPKRLKVHREQ
uniref:Uncharacterized protein n=1 Tax=Arundo donax TaxID=35708 RepID=A0A0A9HFH7_ARUDO